MYDYYLNTVDEPGMRAALLAAGAATELDGEWVPVQGVDVSVIGLWHERTGGTAEEPVMSALPGWHFNVRSVEPIEWGPEVTVTTPVTPWRVWA